MLGIEVNDILYGRQLITEPVLLELLASKPMQRLKHVNQHGPMRQSQPERATITRYDHSLGVLLLLRRFRASLEEQIAGLLHDVSHTAFSHVVDYAVDRDSVQNFHEEIKSRIVGRSEIPIILQRYGFNPDTILLAENFKLLERNEPELCADRLDYGLRDQLVTFNLINSQQVQTHLQNLRVKNNEWYFASQNDARQWALDFMNCAESGWYTAINMAAFHTLGTVMRLMLEREHISEDDLFVTDDEFYARCKQCPDPDIQDMLNRLENLKVAYDEHAPDFTRSPKLRVADPLFESDGRLQRLSEYDQAFKQRLASHTAWIKNGIPVRYLN